MSGDAIENIEESIYVSHSHENSLCLVIWNSTKENANDSLYTTSVQTTKYEDLAAGDRSEAPNASHRLVSRLVTQVDKSLLDIGESNAATESYQHFCLVGEDLHILMGILLGIVENESQNMTIEGDTITWAKALTSHNLPLRLTYRHSNFVVNIDNSFIRAVQNYKNIDKINCTSLRDRLISIVALLATYSNPFVPSNASFESTEKGSSAFIEGLDQISKYLVQFRDSSKYKDNYILGQEGQSKLVPIHMHLAFYLLKANKGDIYGSNSDQYRLHLVDDENSLLDPQNLIEKIMRGAIKYDINDCKTPPGKKGFLIKSQIIRYIIHFLAHQIHNRSSEEIPYIVMGRALPLDLKHFNTTEIWYDGLVWRAIILTYNVFIIRRYGIWRILVLYCMCTAKKCNKLCLCYRFCLPCCALCFRHASPHKKEREYQHVLLDTAEEASVQYMEQYTNIENEMDNRVTVTFRHVDLSKGDGKCEYYGQVSEEGVIEESTSTRGAEEDDSLVDDEGIRIPGIIMTDENEEGERAMATENETDMGSSSSSTTLRQTSMNSVIKETSFPPGTRVAVYDKPLKGKGRSKPGMIGRGIITSRPVDGLRYINRSDMPEANIYYTPSRKEVRFHQLISKLVTIPFLKNYYPEGTKFVDEFGEVSPFECLIAESHLGIDELATEMEDERADLGEKETEDFGEREPGGEIVRQELLLFGTDKEILEMMEKEGQSERIYVSRDDERLGLNENHEDYLIDNED